MLAALKAQRLRRRSGALSSPPPADTDTDGDTGTDSDGDDHDHSRDDAGEEDGEAYLRGDLDADLEDFIIKDTPADLLGAPDDDAAGSDAAVPLQVTAASHASTRTQFQIYAEWLVCDSLFPGLVVCDAKVANALRRLQDRVAGLNQLVVTSSAWTPAFTRALRARPGLRIAPCPSTGHCDACNRNRQHCTHSVRFTGRRYDHVSLDDLTSEADDAEDANDADGLDNPDDPDDANDTDDPDDTTGEPRVRESAAFALGSSCFRRARSAHVLAHWRKELHDWLCAALVRSGVLREGGDVADPAVLQYSDQGPPIPPRPPHYLLLIARHSCAGVG